MMIRLLRKKGKYVSLLLVSVFVSQIVGLPVSYALTSGPSQPEVQSFQPAGTTDMVDLFSGDFSYNIPLFELPGPNGGYPFNLSYQSGISMDQEASWVGLGWSLQPGAITRQMRGLPDEFNGDPVYTKMSVSPNITVGIGVGITVEFFGADKAVGSKSKKGLSVSFGFSVYQNNYRGMGYTLDSSVGFSKANSSGQTSNIGLSTSIDSQEGLNVSPTIGLGTKMGTIGLGVGYNSKSGLSTLTMSHSYNYKRTVEKENGFVDKKGTISQSSTLSLAHPGYTPQVSMPMRSLNISTTFKIGGAMWGVYPDAYATGFYNEQKLKDDKKRVRTDAFGYMHYQDVSGSTALTDFNREKDGMVSKESPNLAIPSLSYDIYSVVGQGISAMYRPMRNDYGIVYDPETTSKSTSIGTGVDVGIPAHLGLNLSVSYAESTSGKWTKKNDMISSASFQSKRANDAYEPWYFKVHGEQSSEKADVLKKLGGESAVRVKLTTSKSDPVATNELEKNRGWSQPAPSSASTNPDRKSRSQVIQPITNEELLGNGQEILPHFRVKYIDQNGTEQVYSRADQPAHHVAAFTALTPEGLRYNYGIPAYNLLQEEVTFSVKKQTSQVSRVNTGNGGNGDPSYSHDYTDKYLKRVEMPKYAHSHLLTSILGPDYVDVTNDGVTDDDLGYWVKFTYQRTNSKSNPYKWRDPFSKAHLQEGWKTDSRDDKASFVYGEKELYYMAKAETKSHIAIFSLQERKDGKGVAEKLQDENTTGKSVYALQEIKLYTRSAGASFPIKVVKFQHDYSLCPGVYNNDDATNPQGGKLTLKKVWFEYGNSQRGSFNPYVFTYHSNNPAYDILTFDRWGTYKPYPVNKPYHNADFPYSEQSPTHLNEIHDNAAAWSLTKIQLPSGGSVTVDYESDDYAYVQHKQAMQMVQVVNPEGPTSTAESQPVFQLNYDNTKVRFKLESPLATLSGTEKAEVIKYLDQVHKQLFFKLKINLLKPGKNAYEYISGYADIDFTQPMGLEKAGNDYTYGYFHLKKEKGTHPFAVRAWQHLRVNQPELVSSGAPINQTSDKSKRVGLIKGLASMVGEIRRTFEGFNKYCRKENYAKEISSGDSWIRLNSPDKKKHGGGLRVRQITLKDNWSHDEEGVYGQVYDYTIQENGNAVSSGVASYEPFAGGEENPLRYAKKYVESVPLRTDNNLFFEYPINETYYPGAQVGYRKVTVMSLAAAYRSGKPVKNITLSDQQPLFPEGENIGYGTTGMTVHEFYTAKDFPVITEETEKINRPFQFSAPIPFIGSIAITKLAATQGYSIVTNDMHGKPKMVSNYRQDSKGDIELNPISWVKYNYRSTPKVYEQEKVSVLQNVFKDNGDGTLTIPTASEIAAGSPTHVTVGQEQEFFIDMREYEDASYSGGIRVNIDFVYVLVGLVPVTVPWPSIGSTFSQLRTSSTNKVIFKSGILESVEAFDGGSLVKTQNLKWDKLTGATVLTQVNNNFDASIFSYSIPAYTQYQGMGAAYQNVGLAFSISEVQKAQYEETLYRFNPGIVKDKLYPGDEMLLYPVGTTANPIARIIYTGEEENEFYLHSDVQLSSASYQAMIVRSGYRNQLGVSAGNITALEDPSIQGAVLTHTKLISVPKQN